MRILDATVSVDTWELQNWGVALMYFDYAHQRSVAWLVGILTIALTTLAFAQPSSLSNSGRLTDPGFQERPYLQLVQAELQDPPTPEPPEGAEPPAEIEPPVEIEPSVEVEPPTFDSPFLSAERPVRIAQVPDMFGDFFAVGGQLLVTQENMAVPQQFSLLSDLPLAGGSRRVKVAENNKAVTGDRVYFLYNHFHNALQAQTIPPAGPAQPFVRPYQVDRYTLGFEKSFLCGLMSVELRLPLNGTFQFAAAPQMQPFAANFNVQGGKAGNLAVLLKGQLLATDRCAIALGCGIDLPTGSDVRARAVFTEQVGSTGFNVDDLSVLVNNEAVHLLPFFAFSHAPTDDLFFHLFVQADVAASGNPVDASLMSTRPNMPPMSFNQRIGNYTEQNLMHVDFAGGYWLYRDPCARVVRGLAGLLELHYTTSIQDTDNVQSMLSPIPPMPSVQITNVLNRVDVLNLTLGVHCDLPWDSSLRVAGVVPLSESEEDRFFDSEIWVSYIKQL